MYDGKWWVGNIQNITEEENDIQVTFMHPHGPAKSFKWPSKPDVCWVPLEGILSVLRPPVTSNGRQYYIDKRDAQFLADK